jgi:hypothetical protein
MAIAQKRLPAKSSDASVPQPLPSNVQLLAGHVVEMQGQDLYLVAFTHDPARTVQAPAGVLLPVLVPGDEVLLAVQPTGRAAITAVLSPSPTAPWGQRSIHLQSQDCITLACGQATLKLTAQGLARLVALTIEQDARDLLDLDAAEVRIN